MSVFSTTISIFQLGFLRPELRGEIILFQDESKKLRNYLGNIDKIRPRACYRIAVVYVGRSQKFQKDVMHNTKADCSQEFEEFLEGLGWTVDLKGHECLGGYTGSLDSRIQEEMLYFGSSSCEVSFHVLPWMPLKADDSQQIERKRHIGNDTVHIVWCEHAGGYDVSTFVSEVTDIFIVIIPLDAILVQIQIFCRPPKDLKEKMPSFGPLQDGAVVHRSLVSVLARQTAMNGIDMMRSSMGSKRHVPPAEGGLLLAEFQSHPSFFRKKQIQETIEKMGTVVTERDLCVKLFT